MHSTNQILSGHFVGETDLKLRQVFVNVRDTYKLEYVQARFLSVVITSVKDDRRREEVFFFMRSQTLASRVGNRHGTLNLVLKLGDKEKYRCERTRGGTHAPGVIDSSKVYVVEKVESVFVEQMHHKIDLVIFFEFKVDIAEVIRFVLLY